MCCIYSLIICRTFIRTGKKVLKISVYDLSYFIARNARVHSICTSKNQCTYFCGLPETYTLRTTCFTIPVFWVLFFGTFCKEHTTENNYLWEPPLEGREPTWDMVSTHAAAGSWELGRLSPEQCAHHHTPSTRPSSPHY